MEGQSKKAQAALEFLTTYGWAFLVILVMIGALAYFGVLDPGKFTGDRCVFGQPLYCADKVIDTNADYVQVQLKNSLTKAFTIDGVQYDLGGTGSFVDCVADGGAAAGEFDDGSGTQQLDEIAPGAVADARCYMAEVGAVGDKVKIAFQVKYHEGDNTDYPAVVNGDVYATVGEI